MAPEPTDTISEEVIAMGKIAEALQSLSSSSKQRVLLWAMEACGIKTENREPSDRMSQSSDSRDQKLVSRPQKVLKTRPKAKASGAKESYTLKKDIDFGLPGKKDSLFDYLDRYAPNSSIQRNVVFVKYLSEQHSGRQIDADLIFTCYSVSGAKLPGALYGSLIDTAKANKGYGYLDTSNIGDIKLLHKGEVLLHELAHKAKQPKK